MLGMNSALVSEQCLRQHGTRIKVIITLSNIRIKHDKYSLHIFTHLVINRYERFY